jgi:hypothetical protein
MARTFNGIDIERFVVLEGQVIEPVPEDERDQYVYWRAIHLGAVVLNYVQGRRILNTAWGAPWAHFRTDYRAALNLAKVMNSQINQFAPQYHQSLVDLTGIPETFRYPSLVAALDRSYNDGAELEVLSNLYEQVGTQELPDFSFDKPFSPSGGHLLRGYLTTDMLDSYSREFIDSTLVSRD